MIKMIFIIKMFLDKNRMVGSPHVCERGGLIFICFVFLVLAFCFKNKYVVCVLKKHYYFVVVYLFLCTILDLRAFCFGEQRFCRRDHYYMSFRGAPCYIHAVITALLPRPPPSSPIVFLVVTSARPVPFRAVPRRAARAKRWRRTV